jgi:hypothetical protein
MKNKKGGIMYKVPVELKRSMRRVGMTTHDVACLLVEPPGTTAGRLNGYLPLTAEQKALIEQQLAQSEREQLAATAA